LLGGIDRAVIVEIASSDEVERSAKLTGSGAQPLVVRVAKSATGGALEVVKLQTGPAVSAFRLSRATTDQ
jgi:hypothetical protein